MNVIGIIAEYNPFHNGHAYQIKQAKLAAGADLAVVVMSGNFMQRGTPAITDKFTRAKIALENGADLVFELPLFGAAAASRDFAAAGTALLDGLGCITHISYGCETKNYDCIPAIAKILTDEPKEFSRCLCACLKEGKSFPKARELALFSYLHENPLSSPKITEAILHKILSSPNNILALEYETALKKRNSNMISCPVVRIGAGYHDPLLETGFPSASGIRKALFNGEDISLPKHMPGQAARLFAAEGCRFVRENDFSGMLYYKLLSQAANGYEIYSGSSPFLSNRIKNLLPSYINYADFCGLVKTKDITHTRVSRLLLHILLDITKEDETLFKQWDYTPYFRLLGFKKSAKNLLHDIKKKGKAPLLTKPARAKDILPKEAYRLYEKEVFASNLYYGIESQKYGVPLKNEYRKSLVIL